MLKIFGGLFAARQRGVEDGAATPTTHVIVAMGDTFTDLSLTCLGCGLQQCHPMESQSNV